jgi:hypothetical protein
VAVVDEDFSAGVVYVPVMRFAQQRAIVDTGFTTVNPVPPMVCLTHSWWPFTARESASAVLGDERAAGG